MAYINETAAELARLAARARAMADGGVQRELRDAVQKAAAPVPAAIRAGLEPKLPNRYAATLDADLDIKISTRTSADNQAVSVTATSRTKRRKLRRLDAGLLTHPLFGNRNVHWPTQQVTPGFFTQPARDAAPRFRAELDDALRRIRDQLEGRNG